MHIVSFYFFLHMYKIVVRHFFNRNLGQIDNYVGKEEKLDIYT